MVGETRTISTVSQITTLCSARAATMKCGEETASIYVAAKSSTPVRVLLETDGAEVEGKTPSRKERDGG
jgi:hypothetical protein